MSLEDTLKELKNKYISELPEKIKEIESYLEAQDREQIKNCFHKLKGSGKTYGVDSVSDVCEIAEQALRDGHQNLSGITQYTTQVLKEIYKNEDANFDYEISQIQAYQLLKEEV